MPYCFVLGRTRATLLMQWHLKDWEQEMPKRLDPKAMAVTSALMWSGAVLGVGVANLFRSSYGKDFLALVSSIYPGYKGRHSGKQVAVAAGYAAVDGAVTGALFAWLYNRLA